MKKFYLGLLTAVILGSIANIALGYFKYGYFDKFKNYIETKKAGEIKECKQLVPLASSFGSLKVAILRSGKPVENLEVDLSDKPGPNRCVSKTDKEGIALFEKVPAGRMAIYFNSGAFPKELGKDPTIYVEIIKDKTTEKILELPYKQ